MSILRNVFLAAALCTTTSLPAIAADNPAVKALEDYFEFSEYGGATILPEQIPAEDWKKIHVIDT
ncbi:MAG: hypothetical protein Q8O38_02360, partial [Sulfurimicrobium sp.]|nr:hypothetical protein [Sulfurimicrobium sp.]